MTVPSIDELVERSLLALKDFQKATVDVVYDNFSTNRQQRMLIADEVGLGKTIVAKGIIARFIRDRIAEGNRSPLKVTYICSNQVIAHENVGKLDIYPNQQSHDRFASRLTYLAFEPDSGDDGMLRLNTLTPATSFNKGSSTGQQEERRILYSLLVRDMQLNEHAKSLSAILRAGVQKAALAWYEQLEAERDGPTGKKLRPCCHDRFLTAIKEHRIDYSDCELFEDLGIRKSISVYDATIQLAKLVTLKNLNQFRASSDYLVRLLKDVLSGVCVEYIDADIYILDEFQRFKELVNQESDSEAADIARRIFGKEQARILLLSATPFKAYSADSPWESGEEHYKEFRTILNFLFDDNSSCLKTYEVARQGLLKQLLELGPGSSEIDTKHRDTVQQILRRVMCRTERLSVSDDFNAMTIDKWKRQPLQVTSGDLQNFVATDRIVRILNETDQDKKTPLHAPIEFCKSAPFPLSFLDDYTLKKHLRERMHNVDVKNELRANPEAWIDHRSVKGYKLDLSDKSINAKFGQVLREVLDLDRNGVNLLWIPPSLPCYSLAGAFAKSAGFSKTLIFSAWLMVPRMLSSLVSYEVERRTIGNKGSMDEQELKPRKYFRSRPHPVPQLVFSQKKTDTGESANNMSNFALLYPSQTLVGTFNPNESFISKRSISEIRSEVVSKIDRLIEEANLHQFASTSGESDKWYWAAPVLLDRCNAETKHIAGEWFTSEWWPNSRYRNTAQANETSSKLKHFDQLYNCFLNPTEAGLGPVPNDLATMLADVAIGSPAHVAYRAFPSKFNTSVLDRITFAFEVASEFLSLFNKPESIASVRLSSQQATYYRRALEYCVNGCLQSVMDEFIHLLEADCPTLKELYTKIVASMNLGTSSIKVDDLNSFLDDTRLNMRCHYAVDLGNQRMETEEGQNRIKGIRHNFNSPFRPFVLATTSIGQEGLDFHTYCRKIVHWNLPTNPIDLEQREGRINRFKGLVIRQQVAAKYGALLNDECLKNDDLWNALFRIADEQERKGTGKCELIPFWHVEADLYQIERIIPFYPFSRDRAKLSSLLKTLAVYRLVFGQPRQAELVEHLLTNVAESRITEIRKKLMIDLSPINYASEPEVTVAPSL
jgi:hypothetical protein